jgi:hypothetical protein
MSDEKIYFGTGKIVAGKNGYADRLAMSFPIDDIHKMLARAEGEGKGWCKIIMAERKTPSKTGQTHYATIDTWVPTQQAAQPAAQPSNTPAEQSAVDSGEIPF